MTQTERIQELLAERATRGLGTVESAELGDLLAAAPEWDDDGFEFAAAGIYLALEIEELPLPDLVRRRLEGAARDLRSETGNVVAFPPTRPGRTSGRGWTGWIAAAACLALALAGWWPRLAPTGEGPSTRRPSASLSEAADLVRRTWLATGDPAAVGATGEVLWSSQRQQGLMTFRGLEPNDPTVAQYQLWVFDRGRDERYPVDGGVFDVPGGVEEATVAIDAKIEVEEPYLFAVTVEVPGGVVVSDRERIVLVAEV